jgi:hypothetical protein
MDDLPFPGYYATADGLVSAGPAWISEQWEVARIRQKQIPDSSLLLVLDEIQKIENWSETVKKEWDRDSLEKNPLKVILSGSSRLLLQQGLSESLTGRFELIYLGHWSYREMNSAFGITPEQFVWFGGYPGSVGIMDEELRWKQYISDSIIETSISKDILMLTRIERPALLRRLFDFGCAYSGQILSYNKILGQFNASGNTTTLSHYLELLSQAGLLAGIEKFSPNLVRKRSSSPKFLVYNTALISARRHESFQAIRREPDAWGRLVESSVGAQLLNYAAIEGYSLYYWRDRNDEVDYVIENQGKAIAIEFTAGAGHKRSGMKAFQARFNPEKMLLIGKSGLPWEEFLNLNPAEFF